MINAYQIGRVVGWCKQWNILLLSGYFNTPGKCSFVSWSLAIVWLYHKCLIDTSSAAVRATTLSSCGLRSLSPIWGHRIRERGCTLHFVNTGHFFFFLFYEYEFLIPSHKSLINIAYRVCPKINPLVINFPFFGIAFSPLTSKTCSTHVMSSTELNLTDEIKFIQMTFREEELPLD